MNAGFPPDIDPHLFTLYAVAVGYACVGDLNSYEQNSVGNWIIMVGQYILTHAAQQQLVERKIEKHNININSKKAKAGLGPYDNNKSNQTTREEVEYLLITIKKMQEELEKIKKS